MRLLFSFAILLSLSGPSVAIANEGGIVPCGTSDTAMCEVCHLVTLVSNIVNWITGVLFILAMTVITISGVLYVVSAGNPGMITMAKNAIKTALIGVIVVLSAWLVVTYVMGTLAESDSSGGLTRGENLWTFSCEV